MDSPFKLADLSCNFYFGLSNEHGYQITQDARIGEFRLNVVRIDIKEGVFIPQYESVEVEEVDMNDPDSDAYELLKFFRGVRGVYKAKDSSLLELKGTRMDNP